MCRSRNLRGLKKILELEREMHGVEKVCDYLTKGKVW